MITNEFRQLDESFDRALARVLFSTVCGGGGATPSSRSAEREKRGISYCTNTNLPLYEFASANSPSNAKIDASAFFFLIAQIGLPIGGACVASFPFAPTMPKEKATKAFLKFYKL